MYNDIVLLTPFNYTEENYILLSNTIINIVNLNVDFNDWYIIIGDRKNLTNEQLKKIDDLIALLLNYDYNIYFLYSSHRHPAKLKGEFFSKFLSKYENAYFISIDADRIFSRDCFANLVFSLAVNQNADFITYSVVDYINGRNYENYISYYITNLKLLGEVINKYGYTVLPYLKLKFNKINNLIPTKIGSPGFAIHSKNVNNDIINFLLNFNEHKRGHDILLADKFENKYILTDCWALHLGIKMSDYWQGYEEELKNIFSNIEFKL